ncbi:MAG: FHA domain-containing protein [Gemmataceae bacterium]|nr:FHA domain-containing protein [Gemmataceae bacterium]
MAQKSTLKSRSPASNRQYELRIGINAIGRSKENDIVPLEPLYISRRHCVIVVHATGGCEGYHTASRNGTMVNRHRIGHAELLPGDLLQLSRERFLVSWVGPNGECQPEIASADTPIIGWAPTGHLSARRAQLHLPHPVRRRLAEGECRLPS